MDQITALDDDERTNFRHPARRIMPLESICIAHFMRNPLKGTSSPKPMPSPRFVLKSRLRYSTCFDAPPPSTLFSNFHREIASLLKTKRARRFCGFCQRAGKITDHRNIPIRQEPFATLREIPRSHSCKSRFGETRNRNHLHSYGLILHRICSAGSRDLPECL